MASGGFHPNKQPKSESGRRSNWQRSVSSDRDDAQSLNSLPSDIRINNWDLADLHPMNMGDSKRRKKSKGNPEREREQSLSMDSPPRPGESRHQAQASFSRTKINPSTPTSQKVSLENLRQQMMFVADFDHDNADSERNNERWVHQMRSRFQNTSMNRSGSDSINQNKNVDTSSKDSVPDSKEIVARLVQIRDFMKQARSMLENMEKMGERKKTEDVEKVRRLIRNLQDQEQGYKGLLHNTLQIERHDGNVRRDGDKNMQDKPEGREELDDSSVDLEVQTQNSETSDGSHDNSGRPRIEDKLGLGFEDEEDENAGGAMAAAAGGTLASASSNNTLDQMDGPKGGAAASFPVQETEEGAKSSVKIDGGATGVEHQELVRILNEKQQQLQALMGRQAELNVKRRETEKRLMDAQARDNKARAALAAVSTERQLLQQFKIPQLPSAMASAQREGTGDGMAMEERGTSGEDGILKSNIVGYPESDDEDNSNVREGNALPLELLELRRQLNFLRNEFSQVNESPNNMETDSQSSDLGREQLQNKLEELQSKKSNMDKLLQELQMMHAQPLKLQRNNESSCPPSKGQPSSSNIPPRPPPPSAKAVLPNLPAINPTLPPSLQARMKEVASAAPNAVESAMATFSELAARGGDEQTAASLEPKAFEEVQEKLQRLKDVRSQLDQLRDLVEYYQVFKDEASGGKPEEEVFVRDTEMGNRGMNEAPRQSHKTSQNQQQAFESHMQQMAQDYSQHQEQQTQPQQQQQQQQNDTGTGAAGGAQSSLFDLAQLLNLAGNENGDEHSDEDNASVSQSDSQWSNLGPWDDDPEVQEKVRKLKAAKEKLRHLQDLVAFVQQSPEAGSALPQSLGDLAASVEGEAVSQATQTDEPNVSVSEGEVPVEDHRRQREEEPSIESAQAELQQLRKERARLMNLQSQLKHLQSVVGRGGDDQQESPETRERSEEICDNEKTETEQAPNATVVTFASNDELYSKMRRQRILREELRSKKKELEAIMKKDRNKRQYSRNQDNQSDTVSLNTDTFGIPASVDATMATWGGSTVDNLENITEDEDGQADGEDDGYPSDGIVQVEEEEEENDTDNGTYTIEADARQRKNMRKPVHMAMGARPKTSRGRQTFPQPAYQDQTPSKKTVKKTKRHTQSSQRESKVRQENYRSAEDLIQEDEEEVKGKNAELFRHMETRLNNLSTSVDSLVKKLDAGGRQLSVSLSQENTSPTFVPPMQEQMMQLQNQSMMLSFSHIVQSLARQQGDMQQMQQQMQNLHLQIHEGNHEHSFQNLTGGGPNTSHLRPSVSTSALNNSPSFYPLSMANPFSQFNLNNSMSGNMMTPGAFGQSPGFGGHPGPLHNTFPAGSGNLGSNLSLHQQPPTHSFGPSGRDFGQQVTNQLQNPTSSHSQLESTSGQYSNVLQEREEPQESGLDRMNAYLAEKKGEQDSWNKKYDFYTSQGLQVSTPKMENLEAERRRQPTTVKGRRGPVGMENSSDLSSFNPLYGSTSDLDGGARGGGGDNADSVTKLHLSSSYSSIQSIKDEHSRIKQEQGQTKSHHAADDSNTLFDSLRDTIYTEVASLISQNENRPHFLLELFREIRQIDSDLLRQRTLYSVQELINSYLKSSSNSLSAAAPKPAWLNTPLSTQETANSDQTPSESITSEDEEELHVRHLRPVSDSSEKKSRAKYAKFPFEYEKSGENLSSMSTPSNHDEAPFFQDALGETVIDFDSLKRWSGKKGGKQPKLGEGAFLASEQLFKDMHGRPARKVSKSKSGDQAKRDVESELIYGEGAGNDQASESSMSDMPYPRIDMTQLDLQIKQVMMETIPVVKEHLEDICSSQLLAYIKRLVLSLTAQTGSQEFARFFHRQLSSILQDTLEKYEGRTMRECGEDLLVEISDVLFNELAFFRLMQGIEDPSEMERLRNSAGHSYQGRKTDSEQQEDDNDGSSSLNEGEADASKKEQRRDRASGKTRGFHISEAEQEQLGRERDDELASEVIHDADDQDEDDDTEHSYKIELAQSETKPFTRIGSDEDDDGDSDEEHSMEDPSETAVSRNDAKMEKTSFTSQQSAASSAKGPPPVRPETEGAWGEVDKDKQDLDKTVSPAKLSLLNGEKSGGEQSSKSLSHSNAQMNGSLNGGMAAGNISTDNDDEELTVDDLPDRLTVGSSCDMATTPASPAVSGPGTNSNNST